MHLSPKEQLFSLAPESKAKTNAQMWNSRGASFAKGLNFLAGFEQNAAFRHAVIDIFPGFKNANVGILMLRRSPARSRRKVVHQDQLLC